MRFYRIGLLQLLSLENFSLLRSSDAVIFTFFFLSICSYRPISLDSEDINFSSPELRCCFDYMCCLISV